MDRRICLDPGHGGKDWGASYGGLHEKDVNLSVCEYAREAIRAMDRMAWVGLTRVFDRTTSLEERVRFSNNMKVNCFASVHCNADLDPDNPGDYEAKGEEIWIFPKSVEGWELAWCLQDEIDRIFPDEPFRGIKEAPFYVLRHTDAPAVLIEIGFIDKSSSVETFSDYATLRKAGAFVARGVMEYLKGELPESDYTK